ncbi:MAG TPA: glycosyltransferase [Solirubrobacteraceae bacterium]|nr:glycosyltransferase [Solirubrobacteraceae bacterium]
MIDRALPLLWQGPLFDPSGYSDESRCLLYACESQGVRVAAREWPTFATKIELGARHRMTLKRALEYPAPDAPYVEVIHKTIPPASRATLYPSTGPTVLRTMFETDSLPGGWASLVARFDRVWVPGGFNVETFARAGVPVGKLRRFPETVDFSTLLSGAAPLAIPHEREGARFLSVFEFSERKGWRLLLDAWADAFGPYDDVALVIKCSNLVMGVTDAQSRIAEYIGARRTAPIVVIEDYLSPSDMARLYRACDAFVLPSRGEGWGRPFMEAMAVGLPTIGPDWGGSLEFMSSANSFLVRGELVRVSPGDLVFERYIGQRWFDPDRGELSSALRTVAGGGPEVAARAARGARDVRENFSHERVVAQLEQLVAEALGDDADVCSARV